MKINLTETVLRDATQSLVATRMPQADFVDILDTINKAGFYSVECWGGATFDSCLRFLDEDPWQRLRLIKKHIPDSKLQMLLRGYNSGLAVPTYIVNGPDVLGKTPLIPNYLLYIGKDKAVFRNWGNKKFEIENFADRGLRDSGKYD